MFIIRQEQMSALADAQNLTFHNRIVAYLRERCPGHVEQFDDLQLSAAVGSLRVRADAYGFERQSSVLAFIVLCVTVSPNFDRHEHIRELLSEAHLPADFRIAYLADAINEAEWEDARKMGGELLPAKAASQ
jgi:hypothetical protein